MRRQNHISKILVGALLLFIFPLKSFSQDISGVWVGYMYNDTTQQTIHYEIAVNDVNGKTSGFSHTTFVIDGEKNIGVKEVKVRVKKEHVYIEDGNFVYDNYAEPAAKGVKMFSFLTLSANDSAEVLSGIWRTNATRKYNPLTGSIFLEKKKKVEPQQTIIVKKLIELGLANQLAFLPPSLTSQNNVALNDKVMPASSTKGEVKPAKEKIDVEPVNKTTGNEQALAVNENSLSSKNNPSLTVVGTRKQEKIENESKDKVPGKNNGDLGQPVVKGKNTNPTDHQTAAKESVENEKSVALNQTTQKSESNKTSPAPIITNSEAPAADKVTTGADEKASKLIGTKETNEKIIAINQTKEAVQHNKTSPAPITAKSEDAEENKLITRGDEKASKPLNQTKEAAQNNKTTAASITTNAEAPDANKLTTADVKASKPIDTKEPKEKIVAVNQPVQTPQNNKTSSAPAKIYGQEADKSITASQVKESSETTDAKETNKNPINSKGDKQPSTNDLKSLQESKNQSIEKQVATNQKVSPAIDEMKVNNNKNTPSIVPETEKNKEKIIVIGQEKVNTKVAKSNQVGSSTVKKEIAAADNKTTDAKDAEAVNEQKKVKINPLSNQQKPNSLEPSVVIKPKVVTPPAAAELSKRKLETIRTVEIAQDSLVLSLYDNGSIDGDTVSVLMNGKVIMPRVGLLATAISKTIYLTPDMGDSVSVVMYAENLGSIPPNTGLLVIREGPKIYEIRFSGDLNKNSKIILVRKKKT